MTEKGHQKRVKVLLERLLEEALDANSGTSTLVSDVIARELGLVKVPYKSAYQPREVLGE